MSDSRGRCGQRCPARAPWCAPTEGSEGLPDDDAGSPLDVFRDGEPPPRRNTKGPVIWSTRSEPITRPAKGPTTAPPRSPVSTGRRPTVPRPAATRPTSSPRTSPVVPDDVASARRRARGPAPLLASQRAALRRQTWRATGAMRGRGFGSFLVNLVLWAVVCNISFLLMLLWRFDVHPEDALRDDYLNQRGWVVIGCSVTVTLLFRNRNTSALFAVAFGPVGYGGYEMSLRVSGAWGEWAPLLVLIGWAGLARLLTAWYESVARDRIAYREHRWQQAANERRRP
ncbi:hypothetical protein ACFVJ5_15775 [Nocardia sp. NPDC127606]|uniref:hypothetical protein n=1 Tax=Nocardia sp. NPDC127606 TaxID=3345406 RepID=UPI0036363C4E